MNKTPDIMQVVKIDREDTNETFIVSFIGKRINHATNVTRSTKVDNATDEERDWINRCMEERDMLVESLPNNEEKN